MLEEKRMLIVIVSLFLMVALRSNTTYSQLPREPAQHKISKIKTSLGGDIKPKFDFRSFIVFLEETNRLVRIKKEVDPKFELPTILWKFQPQKKAVFFEKVKGSNLPVVGGLIQDMEVLAQSLGMTPTKDFIHFEDTQFLDASIAHPLPFQIVESGPVKEVVKKGQDINLNMLPVPTFFEDDSGPFITGGVGITLNPETGVLNAGIYRIFVMGKDKITANVSEISDLSRIYKSAAERGIELPIAIAIGVDPALLIAAPLRTPMTISELDTAGALKGEPLKVVKCETSELMVPANAEIVIEGIVDFSRKVSNNLGEYAGYYGSDINPVINVTAVTHRRDAIFYTILAGPSLEHHTLGTLAMLELRKKIIKELKNKFPNIAKANLASIGIAYHLIISINKKDDQEPMKLIKEIYQTEVGIISSMVKMIKRIVVVDDDVDIYDSNDIDWAVWTRVGDAAKILILPDVVSWGMDRSAKDGKSVKVGIDATKDIEDQGKLKRVRIPGFKDIQIENYLN